MKKDDQKQQAPWRAPTRRVFMAMVGAAAAALAVKTRVKDSVRTAEAPPSTGTGKTRWIGHC